MDGEKPTEVSRPEEKKPGEIPKELPRVPIAVPIILCPQCYKPMEITGKVDVEVAEKGFFRKGTKSVPHVEYHCPTCGVEWKESLARRGAGCFIATATFGTPMAHEVNILKKFRDSFLLRNRTGEMFVRSYYKLSPPIARSIKKSEVMRRIVRILLVPIVNLFNLLYRKR
ncbi:MAG: hypothetical protein AVW06_00155 [Hadesarchaea archaeon DG-33-1]|nr:MAG: hypothetical protein AVW06_00155 [Hadesarchaea archaeon DG-33-1]